MAKLWYPVKLHTAVLVAILATRAGPARAQPSTGEAPPKAEPAPSQGPESQPLSVELGPLAGAGVRTDDEAAATLTQRVGLLLGFSVLVSPAPAFGLGLTYEHLDLGRARADRPGGSFADLTRDLSTLWLDARLRPLSTSEAALTVTIGPGLSWQSADATGAVLVGQASPVLVPVACAGSDSASLALRAALGGEVRVSDALWLSGALAVEGAALSGDPLDGCVLGAGASIIVSPRAAFNYRLDITELWE